MHFRKIFCMKAVHYTLVDLCHQYLYAAFCLLFIFVDHAELLRGATEQFGTLSNLAIQGPPRLQTDRQNLAKLPKSKMVFWQINLKVQSRLWMFYMRAGWQ